MRFVRLKRAGWALVLSFAVSSALLAGACGGDEERQLPPSTPFPDSLADRLHAMRDRMAEIRELRINEDATEGLLAEAQLRAYIESSLAELDDDDQRDIEASNIAFRLLHLLGPDDDLLENLTDAYSSDVLGLYIPDEDRLVLIGEETDITTEDEFTLVHEYVHSFQDGAFDITELDRRAEDEDDTDATEYGTTTSCIQEGDATLSSIVYAQEVFGDDWLTAIGGDDNPDELEPEDDTPPALERYFAFDYDECALFANDLYRDGGWDAVNDAYEEPPWTTEQIMHPDRYRDREEVTVLRPVRLEERLGGDWQESAIGIFGEFDVYNYLATVLESQPGSDPELQQALAAGAAEGWGVGWMGVYAQGDSGDQDVLVHIALEWDTDEDFAEFMVVYGAVVELVSGGSPNVVGDDGPACWATEREFGYLAWDEDNRRTDIIVTTNERARQDATSDFLSGRVKRSCPA